jgi:NTP pyrophosphatase (non-canonical NTP hydrolase)
MSRYQTYVHELERMHGWLDVDLVHNCFLMGEEVGELFKAVRKAERLFEEADSEQSRSARDHVGEEIVDVLNYLLAIANRLEIDLEAAFRAKNARNQTRTWT